MDPFRAWLSDLAYRLTRRQHLSLQMSLLARLYLRETHDLPPAYRNALTYFTSFNLWQRPLTILDLAILLAYIGDRPAFLHLVGQTPLTQRQWADAAEMLAEMDSLQGLELVAAQGPIFTALVPAVALGSLPMVSFILDSTLPGDSIAFTAFEQARGLPGPEYVLSEQLRVARSLPVEDARISQRLEIFPQ